MDERKKIKSHQLFVVSFTVWLRLLWQNRNYRGLRYSTVLLITFWSIVLSPFHLIDRVIGLFTIPKKLAKSPIFIIGHWRSGTTFLHYLLSKDPQFGYLTYYYSFVPGIVLVGRNWLKNLLKPLLPYKRPQDNVELSTDLPAEEENSVATLTSFSPIHSWFFPKNDSYFHQYGLMQNINNRKRKAWCRKYHHFLRKVSLLNSNKQLVIKNPFNTARIKILLELYPDAKFIHLHRNPTDIFPSTLLMYEKVIQTQFLQKFDGEEMKSMIVGFFKKIMEKYAKEKHLIPQENLIEISYEDFVGSPKEYLLEIYEKWGLTYTKKANNAIVKYIDSKRNYKKNTHSLEPQDIVTLRREWGSIYESMGYPLP